MKKFNKFILLILGIFFFLSGLSSLIFRDKESKNQYQSIIQKNVDKATATARKEQALIRKVIERNPDAKFEEYEISSVYPYFVIKDDSIIYWSSNKYIPALETIKNRKGDFFHEYHRNFGLIVQSEIHTPKSTYKTISLINLYRYISDKKQLPGTGFDYNLFYDIASTLSQHAFAGTFPIYNQSGEELFYVKPTAELKNITLIASQFTLILFSVGILLIAWFSALRIKHQTEHHLYDSASLNLILLVLFVRLWMQILGLPWRLFPDQTLPEYLTDPSAFGDLVISIFALLVVLVYFSLWQYKSLSVSSLKKIPVYGKSLFSGLVVFLVLGVSYLYYSVLVKAYSNDLTGIHNSLLFYLTNFKGVTYLFLFCLFGVYFLSVHLAVNFYRKMQPKLKFGFLHWLYAIILILLIAYYFQLKHCIFIISGIYFLLSYALNLSRYFYILRFKTFIYYLAGAFTYSLILFYVVVKEEAAKILEDKQEFADELLLQRDIKLEVLLNQLNHDIKHDANLIKAIENPVFALQSVNYLIKDSLLDTYFSNQKVDIFVYPANENTLKDNTSLSLSEIKTRYAIEENRTEFSDLFFVKDDNSYYLLSELSGPQKQLVGSVVVKVSQESAGPPLSKFTDKGLRSKPDINKYSYAIYNESNKLIFKQGNYDYPSGFDTNLFNQDEIYSKEVWSGSGYHFVRKNPGSYKAVVTHSSSYYKDPLSNFSYLFLISLLGIVFLLIVLAILSGFRSYTLSFSSKIQFYLNLAFLAPITVIILLTLAVMVSSFITIQKNDLLKNADNVANIINLHYQNYQSGKSSRAYMEEQLNNLSNSSDFDISVFGTNGKIIYTSTPGYLHTHQFSDYINPAAYARIISQRQKDALLDESLGSLNFKTAYLPGKGISGDLYGIIGISYTDADIFFEKQMKEIVSIILIIFFAMFLTLFVLSYTASTNLTDPLKIIAQKLKKTNLEAQNEEIVWKSDDEIGLLTKEYNRMIKKLEESKEALSLSEKQTAWREMARQVAHEIKNPLTPIKLSIQQLQRTLPSERPQEKLKIERALSSINEQIDNITEIANSFSEFAKMPVPRSEVFDMVSTVQKAIDLYTQNNNIKINFITDSEEIEVTGDRMILSRAVSNLILNGIQSVPVVRKPVITVVVSDKGDTGMLEVRDNGTGIPEELRKKVFIPNFSTKIDGSGLGLSMAKRGIEHSGGNIWFETTEGEGTIFYLDLPKTKS